MSLMAFRMVRTLGSFSFHLMPNRTPYHRGMLLTLTYLIYLSVGFLCLPRGSWSVDRQRSAGREDAAADDYFAVY